MLARLLALATAVVIGGLGVLALVDGYAPARQARFFEAGPLFGDDARLFGVTLILLACVPILTWAKSGRQATVLGTVLGLALLGWIFGSVYFFRG